MDTKYSIAYTEVLEILKYISFEDYNKIPKDKINLFKTYANKDYVFKYNPSKTLNEQNVSKIAKGIIAILFRDYWATPHQKEKILKKENFDRQKIQEENKKKYNPDNILKANNNINNEYLPINQKKEGFIHKIIKYIKNYFNKL